MIPREAAAAVRRLAQYYPVVVITGPRQSGKTTLAKTVFADKPHVNLEAPDMRDLAGTDPRGFLAAYPDGVIIDEAQRVPSLFSYLQVTVDEKRTLGKYVLTGSQQFQVLTGVTQSLAGRAGLLHLLPLSASECDTVKPRDSLEERLLRGAYPALFDREVPSAIWYSDYMSTYVERDVAELVSIRDVAAFRKFVRMCATRTSQVLNLAALATDCGVAQNTARAWLSILEASYLVFLLYPYSKNFGKRITKTPKLYFYDCGLAAWLAGVRNLSLLEIGPMRGALFETYVVSEFIKQRCHTLSGAELFFWRDNHGLESDLVIETAGQLQAVEIKAGATTSGDWFPPIEKFAALAGVSSASLVYGGEHAATRNGVRMIGWRNLPSLIRNLMASG